MTQYARPDGHHSNGVGNWNDGDMFDPSQTDLHLLIDEASTNDGDIIQSEDQGSGDVAQFTLSDVDDPESSSDHKVIYRAVGTGGMGSPPSLTIALYDSTVSANGGLIVSQTQTGLNNTAGWPPGDYATYTITLDGTSQADIIADYTALSIKVTRVAGEMGDSVQVSQLYFECPDAAAATGNSEAFLLFVD
jgi:hypothetical protein